MEQNAEFIKVKPFLEDILALHGVSKNTALLLFELIPYLNQKEEIIVNSYLKKDLAAKTDLSKGTIDNTITKLHDVGLLLRLGRGTYTFHPVLYEMKKLLKDEKAKLSITYKGQSRKIESD